MDHRQRPEETAPSPAAAPDDRLAAAVAQAGAEALRVRLAGYLSAMSRATRSYLQALAEMHLAARIGDDLRAAGLDLPADPLGSAATLAEQFRRVAGMAVAGGLIDPADPLLTDAPR